MNEGLSEALSGSLLVSPPGLGWPTLAFGPSQAQNPRWLRAFVALHLAWRVLVQLAVIWLNLGDALKLLGAVERSQTR